MSIVNDLINVMDGTIADLPTLVIMAVPLVVGLLIGFILKRLLKIGIILGLIALVAVYFGFINLDTVSKTLSDLVYRYGPIVMSYVAVFFGIVPLGLGLVIGVSLGFIFG